MRTINLLPKAKQEELHYEVIFYGLVRVFWLSCASFLLVFAVQFGVKIYVEYKVGVIQAQIGSLNQQVSKQDNAAIKSKVAAVNNAIADFNTLTNNAPKWSKLIRAFAALPPAGIRINNMMVDPKSRQVTISGFSPTRELVDTLYYNILADTANFSGIDYYFENIAKSTNDNFHFTFSYMDNLVTSK